MKKIILAVTILIGLHTASTAQITKQAPAPVTDRRTPPRTDKQKPTAPPQDKGKPPVKTTPAQTGKDKQNPVIVNPRGRTGSMGPAKVPPPAPRKK